LYNDGFSAGPDSQAEKRPARTVNPPAAGGVLSVNGLDDAMRAHVERLADGVVTVDADLEREFEARLVESSTLAFRIAYGVLRNRQDAEDVAQDVFVKAYRRFAQLRDRTRFRKWLVRMTWRMAIDRQRADRRRSVRELAHAEQAPIVTNADDVTTRERAAALWRAIDALSDKLRIVVILAGIEGYDLGEVGRLLGLPEGTVKSRLFLARQRLKEHLQWPLNQPANR
jgi:RNA polymerase sigma-70 factor (ECF subfamily)